MSYDGRRSVFNFIVVAGRRSVFCDVMAAALKEASLSEADDWIRVWRKARLSSGHAVGWPNESMWARLVEMRILIHADPTGRIDIPPDTDDEGRAVIVQVIVESMPETIRGPFEAYNIGVIRGDSCRHLPPKARRLALGIQAKSTYHDRIDQGRRYVAVHLGRIFDRERSFAE